MDTLIIGCGYLGRRVARLWRERGERVAALTRRAEGERELAHLGITAIRGDVLDPPELPAVRTVLFAVGWDRTSGQPMRHVYVDGLARVLDRLPQCEQFLYISSTSVYGQTDGSWVDESSPTEPEEEGGKIVLEAERLLRARLPEACMLRFAGIYGPGRLLRQKAIEAGEVIQADPERHLNLIHVDDGARAVLAAEAHGSAGAVINVADGQPVRRVDFYCELARVLRAPGPRFAAPVAGGPLPAHERAHRRVGNERLVGDLQFTFLYPSYREGLSAAVSA